MGNHQIRKLLCAFVCLALLPTTGFAQQDLNFGPGADAQPEGSAEPLDGIAAVVNDEVITRIELTQSLVTVREQLSQRGVNLPPERELARQVLERLILQKLQARAAAQNGVGVDDQTLNAAIEQIARTNNISVTQLRETLERDGISFADFREDIRSELLATRLRQRVVDARLQVSEQEVDTFLSSSQGRNVNAEYRLGQIVVGVPQGATPAQIEQAEGRLRQVMQALQQGADFRAVASRTSDSREALDGGDLGWRSLAEIPSLFAAAIQGLEPGQVSPPVRSPRGFHIFKLYETRGSAGAEQQPVDQVRLRRILIDPELDEDEAKTRLERLAQRARQGEDFAVLARANSADTGTATQGGDLGWQEPGNLPPSFNRAVASLGAGEVSEPFQTSEGWQIAQVVDRRVAAPVDEAARQAAREALRQQKSAEEWELWLQQLRDEAYVDIRVPELREDSAG